MRRQRGGGSDVGGGGGGRGGLPKVKSLNGKPAIKDDCVTSSVKSNLSQTVVI